MHEIETHFKSAQPGLSQPGQALKMKGLEIIKSFLQGGEPLTEDSLPSRGPRVVDREALIHTIMSFHKALRAASLDGHAVQELVALKKANPTTTSTSPDGETAPESGVPNAPAGATMEATGGENAPETRETAETPVPMNGVATPDPSEVPTAASASPDPSTQNGAAREKTEKERLCKSMWGKVDCPRQSGQSCVRVHLDWCSKPSCAINEEQSKTCPLWHGHMRAALHRERVNKRKEAKRKKEEEDQRLFKEWKKQQGNKKPPGNSERGPRKQSPQGQPQGYKAKGQEGQKSHQQKGKPTRRPVTMGDYMPPQLANQRAPTLAPAPPPAKTAWPRLQKAIPAAMPDPRQQIQDLLQHIANQNQSITMLLSSGVF